MNQPTTDNRQLTTGKQVWFLILLLVVSGWLFVSASSALAQTDYQLLAPLPGYVKTTAGNRTTASAYISGIFTLLIAVAGGLAVIMIIWGGIKYMSTDAIGGKSEAKDTIQNAIWGLLLALGAYIILNTINTRLTDFNLNIERLPSGPSAGGTGVGGGGVLPGYSLTEAQVAEDIRIRLELGRNRPPVLVDGRPCKTGGTIGCTNVVGLPQSALDSVTNLASACGCSVRITGGTEGGHAEHGQELSVLDLRANIKLNGYLAKTNPQAATPQNGTVVAIGSTTYTYETAAGRSTGNHWHVNIG